jgi:hypothetical protein
MPGGDAGVERRTALVTPKRCASAVSFCFDAPQAFELERDDARYRVVAAQTHVAARLAITRGAAPNQRNPNRAAQQAYTTGDGHAEENALHPVHTGLLQASSRRAISGDYCESLVGAEAGPHQIGKQ